MRIHEPGVTITDLILAIECVLLAALLYAPASTHNTLAIWFMVSFLSIGLSATLGGVLHGFLVDPADRAHIIVWRAILASLGVAALATWILGALILFGPEAARIISIAAATVFCAYLVAVLSRRPAFSLAIAFYLPAAVFLLVAFLIRYLENQHAALLAGTAGTVLSLLAAIIQHKRIGLHPRLFNHNALYHLVQAIALVLIFYGARALVS